MDLKNNFKEVGEFYGGEIANFWRTINKGHMHVSYFDETNMNASIAEGARRLTDMMIEKAQVSENKIFIDIGCGLGQPAIELAKKKKCNIYGITASDFQKIEAQKAALQENIANLINFTVCDAKKTIFRDNLFDGGWFFESIFHIGHEEALQEAYRILKPGAVLLIADFLAKAPLKEAEQKEMFDRYKIITFKTFEEYPAFVKQSGFELVELLDITYQTIRVRKKKYIEEIEKSHNKEALIKLGGAEFYEDMKQKEIAVDTFLEDKQIGYAIITLRKG